MYPNFISKDYSNFGNIIIILNILDRKRRHILNAIICHQNIGKASKINKLLIININRESVIHQKRLHFSNKANRSKLRQVTLKQIIYENINRSISIKYLYSARSRKVSGNFSKDGPETEILVKSEMPNPKSEILLKSEIPKC